MRKWYIMNALTTHKFTFDTIIVCLNFDLELLKNSEVQFHY